MLRRQKTAITRKTRRTTCQLKNLFYYFNVPSFHISKLLSKAQNFTNKRITCKFLLPVPAGHRGHLVDEGLLHGEVWAGGVGVHQGGPVGQLHSGPGLASHHIRHLGQQGSWAAPPGGRWHLLLQPALLADHVVSSVANRSIGEVVQSRRRPLPGPSPLSWLKVPHLRLLLNTMLNGRWPHGK